MRVTRQLGGHELQRFRTLSPCNVKTGHTRFLSLSLSFSVSLPPLLFPNTTEMQSTAAMALSASNQFLKPPCQSPNLKLSQLSKSSSSTQLDHHVVRGLSCQSLSHTIPSSSRRFNTQISAPCSVSGRRYDNFVARAALLPESAGDAGKPSGLAKISQLGSMVSIWYLSNICFNIINKQVLISIFSALTHFLYQLHFDYSFILITYIKLHLDL